MPPFTIGIEEEYLLVDPKTRDLVVDPPPELMDEYRSVLENQVAPEFLRSQVEVGTRVCQNLTEARSDLARLRTHVAEVADRYGLAPIAASTHPFAQWEKQRHTDADRYNELAQDLQAVVRRLLISGMHVHVGIDNDELRIDLMSQVSYFLPHLLALSTSSPFWNGINTGLKSYRLTVFDAMPRTGLPEQFNSWGEYKRHVDVLIDAGIIEDATKIWWDVRPSARYPTLEMRISDICTRLEDTVTVAALYQALLHMLFRRRTNNQRWRNYSNMLIQENRWRAQRYGMSNKLMDFGKGELVEFADLTDELLTITAKDGEVLGTTEELLRARDIVARGTSADRQLDVYEKVLAESGDERKALDAVVDWLIEETLVGF
jgi:carboxylate-amine ligase